MIVRGDGIEGDIGINVEIVKMSSLIKPVDLLEFSVTIIIGMIKSQKLSQLPAPMPGTGEAGLCVLSIHSQQGSLENMVNNMAKLSASMGWYFHAQTTK